MWSAEGWTEQHIQTQHLRTASSVCPHCAHVITSSSLGTSSRLPQVGQKLSEPILFGTPKPCFAAIRELVSAGMIVPAIVDCMLLLRWLQAGHFALYYTVALCNFRSPFAEGQNFMQDVGRWLRLDQRHTRVSLTIYLVNTLVN